MFDIDKKWISRLYQALNMANLLGEKKLISELEVLELKFYKGDLEDFEWARLAEIEDLL